MRFQLDILNCRSTFCFAGLTLLGDESPRVIMEDDEKDSDKLAI